MDSDLAYLTGKFNTGFIRHDVAIGGTGYRFASFSPVTSPAKTALCTENTPQGICTANISDPLVDVVLPGGIFSYAKTSPSPGIYVSSIIRQQGFSFSDSMTISPQWIVRLAASQDWTWTDMTVYATFADSIQAPDVAGTSTATTIIVNASQALPPYRSKQEEIGYKLRFRSINFSVGAFRLERPFANLVTGVTNPVCGTQSGTANCEVFQITGNQLNYGIETMLSGRVFERLMLTGGLTGLRPRLT